MTGSVARTAVEGRAVQVVHLMRPVATWGFAKAGVYQTAPVASVATMAAMGLARLDALPGRSVRWMVSAQAEGTCASI